ncbi:MAG: HU family DNA-binding protein, partial [Finegoldia magna]|nr:HU family DNA-binding protein [Finegoldia magna]
MGYNYFVKFKEEKMNKSELLTSIAKKSELSKVESERALNAFIKTVEETLAKGEKVQLVGFGTFES